MLNGLESRFGIFACLGNHDYGIGGAVRIERTNQLDQMVGTMRDFGIRVLRNQSSPLEIDGQCLWFVGLGDLWADDFEPEKAFANVDYDGTVIALSHNPETIKHLHHFEFDALLSGHTHGCSMEWTVFSDKPLLKRRRYVSGLYDFGDKKMYVNRGLGRHGRAMFNKRPEITVYNLS